MTKFAPLRSPNGRRRWLSIILALGIVSLCVAAFVPRVYSGRLPSVLLALVLVIAVSARVTLFSSQRVRRMRWRIMFRLHPGPGFATS